jgi:predicted transcriptional regulator
MGEPVESDVEDESDDGDDYGDEQEQLSSLMQRIDELSAEKGALLTLNAELQKKAVQLIAREKAMQGQTAAARTAAEVVSTLANGENPEGIYEQNQEKEKQYQENLQLIVEERLKLNKQLREFDQLALDLQTRLDDKELKANGIMTSFKQFKK